MMALLLNIDTNDSENDDLLFSTSSDDGPLFNVVHFPCNYILYLVLNANLLHTVCISYLLLRHVSALAFGHLQGDH
jgi:hypothetical protein